MNPPARFCGRLLLAGFLGWFWLILTCCAFGVNSSKKTAPPEATPALTLEEVAQRCTRAFAAGDWASAVAHGTALLRDYGDRTNLAPVLQRIQLLLLECHLHLHQWKEAAPLFEPVLQTLHTATPEVKGQLLLQEALCRRNLAEHPAARRCAAAALQLLPANGASRSEAFLLLASCVLEAGEPEEAGNILESSISGLPFFLREKALMLGMHAFLRAGKPERAFAFLLNGSIRFPTLPARIGIQRLILEAASASLQGGKPNDALTILAKLEPPERLLSAQKHRLTRLVSAGASQRLPREVSAKTDEETAQLQAELEAFGNGATFSEYARLLNAAVYRALNRPHEAALVLQDAIAQLAPSEHLESASLELAKTWFDLERWELLLDSVERFSDHYPKSKHLPLMHYLKGCAEQRAGLLQRALNTFRILSSADPADEFSRNATFMHALTLLLDNKLPEADEGLRLFWRKNEKHPFAEAAAYWLCVAKAREGSAETLRTAANGYLKSFPKGENRPAVLLRRAQASNALNERATAIPDLEAVLAESPKHACGGESCLLLGDCYVALGKEEKALAAWRSVPEEQGAAREEGLLKCAKLLFRAGRFTELRELLKAFVLPGTDAPRIAEAAGWLWKADTRQGCPENAAAWALKHIELLGNEPSSTGVEALLSLAMRHAGTSFAWDYWSKGINALATAAKEDGRLTLRSRLQWADAAGLRAQNPREADEQLIRAATLCPPPLTGPAVLADGAAALERTGQPAAAAGIWRELLKWHPAAPQKDRALCALAQLDHASQQVASAWMWLERFEQATPTSPLRPWVSLVKAALQSEAGKSAEALKTLNQLLRDKHATAASKSEALFRMGDIHLGSGSTRVAISYFQRTYVSYSRCQPWAAKAYLASAEAFRKLGDVTAAHNTYKEFLASDAPADAPERQHAISELKALEATP